MPLTGESVRPRSGRTRSELFRHADLIHLRLEGLQSGTAFAADAPFATLLVVLGLAVDDPAGRQRLGDLQARGDATECRQSLVGRVEAVRVLEVTRRERGSENRVVDGGVGEKRGTLR